MMRENSLFNAVIIAVLIIAEPARADELATKEQINEVLKEVRDIKKLLEQLSTSNPEIQNSVISYDVSKAPMLGSKDAPLTIVSFTDYQCSFCQRFYQQVFPAIKDKYVDTGKARFYSVDFPLDSHPNAMIAAQAGRCASDQGRFWAMHDRLQQPSSKHDLESLLVHAKAINLNEAAFEECLKSDKHKAAIEQSIPGNRAQGIRGTPSFIIGKSTANGVKGRLIFGAVPFSTFERKLTEQLP